jgi:hypothetical protein
MKNSVLTTAERVLHLSIVSRDRAGKTSFLALGAKYKFVVKIYCIVYVFQASFSWVEINYKIFHSLIHKLNMVIFIVNPLRSDWIFAAIPQH